MKKIFLIMTLFSFMAGSISTTCGQQPDKKSVKARENLNDAKKDVADAKKDSISDYYKFKKDAENKILIHEKSITDYKERIEKEMIEISIDFDKKMAVLDQQSADLKKKMEADKARIIKEKLESRITYDKKISELEEKNTDLKKKLEDYKESGIEKWSAFKIDFSRQMDELGKSLKEMTSGKKK